jgi:hypothetical protein
VAKGFARKEPDVPREHTGALLKWSYSTWSSYEKCPRSVWFKQIQKVPEVGDRKALDRGIAAHTNCENAVITRDMNHLIQPVPGKPTKLHTWQDRFIDLIRDGTAQAEQPLALAKGWLKTGWFASNAWLRGKLDARKAWKVIDYKTGKVYPEHAFQADLYASMVIADTPPPPEVEEIEVDFWYIDEDGTVDKSVVTRKFRVADQEQRILAWEHRIAAMLNDDIFPARVGMHCNWCGFSGRKGGPCDVG